MKPDVHASWWKRAVRGAAAALVLGGVAGGAGCLSRPIDVLQPRTTDVETDILHQQAIDKIDLLLAIDNSASMADKQAILAEAVPDLVVGLLNPPCVNDDMTTTGITQPTSPIADCPGMSQRAFTAVKDVHIGIVSSSLGGRGSDACGPNEDGFPNNDDHGYLITRSANGTGTAPTYSGCSDQPGNACGFLDWDPTGMANEMGEPPGLSVFNGPNNQGGLVDELSDLVKGTGQSGCGYEAQLESWYRFLADPAPSQSVMQNSPTSYSPVGLDQTVLTQRADFMRSDSLLAVIMLTDENDCSVREYSFYPVLLNSGETPTTFPVPPAPSSACATKGPTDPCCYSCGLSSAPGGCPAKETDPGCMGNVYPDANSGNLRCFHDKQRFGLDYLYPIERYQYALTEIALPDPHAGGENDGTNKLGPTVPNPIFSDLHKDDPNASHVIRDPGLVFIAGIVGVPWQDIAEDWQYAAHGKPLVFKTAEELATADIDYTDPNSGMSRKVTTWDVILGDPEKFVDPLDPHMIESITPRTGTDPITGTPLAPATTPSGQFPDPLNGHEWDVGKSQDDLQYSCIFQLPTSKPCTNANQCDCSDPTIAMGNPLCADDGMNGFSLQTHAKGYQGVRELQVLQSVGTQGIVGSICPANTMTGANDPSVSDFGYRAAVAGIINRLKQALGGQCTSQVLKPNDKGQVQCLLIEARKTNTCDTSCKDHAARVPVPSANKAAVQAILDTPDEKTNGWNCFCEIEQVTNIPNKSDALTQCLTSKNANPLDMDGSHINGWCYVDPEVESNANPEIVANCPSTEQRLLRFVGTDGQPQNGSTVFITCSGDSAD